MAFLHDDIGLETETVLRRLGFRVMRPGLPLELGEIEHKVRHAEKPLAYWANGLIAASIGIAGGGSGGGGAVQPADATSPERSWVFLSLAYLHGV